MNPFSPEHYRFFRDSRHAFGHRFYVDRQNRDWIWGAASLAAFCLAVVVMAGQI